MSSDSSDISTDEELEPIQEPDQNEDNEAIESDKGSSEDEVDRDSDQEISADEVAERGNDKLERKRKIIEESEDDGEGLEEEYALHKSRKKKRRNTKRRLNGRDFIQDDVEVDEDDDEDDYEPGNDDDIFGVDPSERAEAERYMKEQEKLKERRRNKYVDMTEEEMERYFHERHAAQVGTHRGDIDEDTYDDITQNGLLPTTKDPNLWLVKCRIGEEKQLVLQLMRKYIAYQSSTDPLQIKSLFAKEGLKGFIYIEAFKKSHVATAIEGIQSAFQNNINMVPIKEMSDTLKVVRDIPTLKPGTYVRLKRGLYKDDLGYVDCIDLAQNSVNLKLVPRVDYTRLRGALRNQEDRSTKSKRRPQPILFDPDRIRQVGGDITNDGDFMIFESGHYRRGFLFKKFPLDAIISEGVKPTIPELERFQETAEDLKKELESIHLKEKKHNLLPGDNVEVIDGELINLRGKVQGVDGDKILILPEHEELKEPLTLNAFELRKYFKVGDHVRVIGGRYEGDTGLIVRVEDNMIILLSDLSIEELKVLPKDLQLCADITTGVDSAGHFQYQDLVMIDSDTVGVIVRLERENVEVLTSSDKIMRIRPQAIQSKRDSRLIKAFDSQRNTLQVGDLVKVIDGPYVSGKKDAEDDKQGQVKHIFRTSVWVYSRKHVEHGGIFVSRAKNLLLVGAKPADNQPQTQTVDTELLRSPHPLASPRPNAVQPTPGQNAPSENNTQPLKHIDTNVAHTRRNAAIIGKSVRIKSGPMKGYVGIVKDATESSARIELHAIPKTITIDIEKIMEIGGKTPEGLMGPNLGAQTPSMGYGRTPMYGGAQTPMYGGASTPMHDASRTPHYGLSTPAYGAQTPSHQGSAAWDPTVANTPAHSHFDEEFDPQGFGGTTPAFGGTTPGGATPSGFGGATPGGYGSNSYGYGGTPAGDGDFEGFGNQESSSSSFSGYPSTSPYQRPRSGFGTAPTSASPAGPASLPDEYLRKGQWCHLDLYAVVKRTYRVEELREKSGMISRITDNECEITFEELGDNRAVPFEFLLPVKPDVGDMAMAVHEGGGFIKGKLSAVEGNEGVLKVSDKTLLFSMGVLCKYG